jgi:acetyl-CoA carboxylase biotin carboxylase subunit
MQRALDMLVVEGIKTTIPLHKKIMADAAFQRGDFSTKFMEEFSLNSEEKAAAQ